MPRALLPGFHVSNEDVILAEDKEVWLAGEGAGPAAEAKGVLVFDADLAAAVDPEVALLVEEGGVVGQPLGLVEVRGLACPALVVSFEPDCLLAGSFAGEQAR